MTAPDVLDLRSEARFHALLLPDPGCLRDAAQETWRGRMVNEYASATVFEELARHLGRAGFASTVTGACAGFADEERRHGVLCGAVVEALGGTAQACLPPARPFPPHSDVTAMEGAIRNLLSVSCLSETVAVALIGAERLEMPEGPLRDLLTKIYADEVGHARFGWRLVSAIVPSLDRDARVRLSKYLVVALAHLKKHELGHLPLQSSPPAEGAALGLCSGHDARTLFYETIDAVILPRLEDLGLAARRAWTLRHRVGPFTV